MSDIEKIIGKLFKDIIKPDLDLKAKELKIPNRTKFKKQDLIDKIIEYTNNPPPVKEKKKTEKKKTIPKPLKNIVWDTYIGKDKGTGECVCCHKEIDSKHFECGHVTSEADGGTMDVNNLRPVCSLCNKSMGKQNLNTFTEIINIKKSLNTQTLNIENSLNNKNPLDGIRKILSDYAFVKEQPTITWEKNDNIFQNNLFGMNNIKQNPLDGYREAMGIKTTGQYESRSNIDGLISKMDYNTIVINKLTKLWCIFLYVINNQINYYRHYLNN